MSEEILIKQGAPTLAGIKTGSLFSCPYETEQSLLEDVRRMNGLLVPKGLCLLPLRYENSRVLLYLYRPRALQKDPSERSNFACHMNRHGASSSGEFSPVYQIFLSIAISGNHRIPAKSAYPFGAFFCIAARSATLPCPVIYSK